MSRMPLTALPEHIGREHNSHQAAPGMIFAGVRELQCGPDGMAQYSRLAPRAWWTLTGSTSEAAPVVRINERRRQVHIHRQALLSVP